jgi:hypothetical protein
MLSAGKGAAMFAARSVYAVDAATIESGESESVEVENVTPGLAVIIR